MSALRPLPPKARGIAIIAALVASLVIGHDSDAAWQTERDIEVPTYAVAEPTHSNLNIDSVVLMCEAIHDNTALQLQIYLTDDGPFRPNGVSEARLKPEPRAEIEIDGKPYAASLLFADDYVVLTDSQRDPFPVLSDRLLDAMQAGKHMVLRFDLAAERPGTPAAYDGEAMVDLDAAAISSVRRCAGTPDARGVAALAHH